MWPPPLAEGSWLLILSGSTTSIRMALRDDWCPGGSIPNPLALTTEPSTAADGYGWGRPHEIVIQGAVGSVSVLAGVWEERTHGLTLPNGIGWSPDGRSIYYVDTFAGVLWKADFDVESTIIGHSEPFFEMPMDAGLIDGLSVDLEGGVWVAVWGGAAVLRLDPEGRLTTRVSVDAPKVTSCAFGGETLFITTADPEGVDPPGSGGLFAVDIGIEGVPVEPALLD